MTTSGKEIDMDAPLTNAVSWSKVSNMIHDQPLECEHMQRVRIQRRTDRVDDGVELDIEIEGYNLDDTILLAQALLK